jgi:probable O-glycosylation ligase (exosortase A-associated)
MKLALLALITLFGVGGSLAFTPFIGLAVYYLFATLRPQYLWEHDLPQDVPWSFFVALSAMFGVFVWKLGEWARANTARDKIASPPQGLAHLSFFFFAVWIIITYYTAGDKEVAFPAFNEYIKIFVMYGVASVVITNLKQLWTIYLIVTGSLCYIALEMNDIYFRQGFMKIYRSGYGGLDNNGAALMLAMGVPLCLFAWDGIRHWVRWGFLLMIPFIIEAVMISFSRGAMLSILVCSPLFLLRCTRKRQITILMVILGSFIVVMAGSEIRDRFFSVQKFDQDDSANSRLTSWKIAWQMANEHPFFGFGIRNSNLHTYSYGADMEGRTIHSQYLQIAADSGLMGLSLYLITIGFFMLAVRKARRHTLALIAHEGMTPDSQLKITIVNGLESSMVIFCVGGAFLSLENFELPYIVLLMGAQLWSIISAQEYKLAQTQNPLADVYQQLAKQLPTTVSRGRMVK